MPAALLPLVDLGAIALAILATLLAIAAYVIVKAIAACLPSIDLVVVSFDPGKWFEGIADDIEGWIVKTTKGAWADLARLFHATAWLFSTAFGDVVNAISTHADFIAHIVTSVIPNAIHAAEAQAGKDLAAAVDGLRGDISTAVTKVEGIVTGDVKAIDSTISTDIGTVEGDITRGITRAISTAEHYADVEVGDLRDYVDQRFGAAEDYAAGLVSSLARTLGQQIASAAATAQSNLISAEHTLEGDITTAANTAAKALSSAESSIESTISSDVTSIEGTITSDVSSIYGDITAQAQAFAGDLSGLQSLLEGIIAGAIAGVVARVAKLEECSVGVCEDSPNNFSNLLSQALGFVDLAAFLAFVGEAVKSPASAVDEFAGAAEGIYHDADDVLSALLNL